MREPNGLLKGRLCFKRNEHRLLKSNIPLSEPTNDPGQAAEAEAADWSPSRSLPAPWFLLSHSTGLAEVQHLLTVYRRADNTKIKRAIISIIHVCFGVPRLKAASRVTHDFMRSVTFSLLLCCPPNPVLLYSYGFVVNFRGPAGKASQF